MLGQITRWGAVGLAAFAAGCSLWVDPQVADGGQPRADSDLANSDGGPACTARSDNLVLWLPFSNEVNPYDDASGFGNNAACDGACPSYESSGRFGPGALAFDRRFSTRVRVLGHSSLRGDSGFTIAAFVNPASIDNGERDTIMSKAYGLLGDISWEIGLSREDETPKLELRADGGGNLGTLYLGDLDFELGSWVHVAVTWSPSEDGYLRLYVDGELVGISDTSRAIDFDDGDIVIGATHGVVQSQLFDGLIDEVRVYSRGLPVEDVLDLAYCDGPR